MTTQIAAHYTAIRDIAGRLDDEYPDWRSLIDCRRLSLRDYPHCLLSQIGLDWVDTLARWGWPLGSDHSFVTADDMFLVDWIQIIAEAEGEVIDGTTE